MGNHDTKVGDWVACFLVVKIWTKTWVIMTIVKENVPDKQSHKETNNQTAGCFITLYHLYGSTMGPSSSSAVWIVTIFQIDLLLSYYAAVSE